MALPPLSGSSVSGKLSAMGNRGPAAPDVLAHAAAELERADWDAALAILRGADAGVLATPEGLEVLAMAAYGRGELETTLTAWEDLHDLLLAQGERQGAARAAVMLAMFLMMDTGLMAPVRGWLRRAERLLEGDDEGPVHAWLAMVRTYERFMSGDMAEAGRNAEVAVELGTRFDQPPPIAIGMVGGARVRVFEGRLDEGLQTLDEVAAMLSAGRFDPLTTGMMWCELVCAMQWLAQYDRAGEWTDAMERWRHGAAVGGINGRCRVHRAELLRIRGPLDAAEEEALQACEELRPWMRREFGWPLTELGNVRLRRGDLDGAEEAFLAAHEHAWSAQPGLALLHLARGEVDAAVELISAALDQPFDVPSKEWPPAGPLQRAPLLAALVEIALAADDAERAAAAAEELDHTAATFRSRALQATAVHARGRVALAAGDHEAARRDLACAVAEWSEVGAPYEAATARLELGQAFAAAGSHEVARVEWRAARSAFERIDARRGVAAVDAELGRVRPTGPPITVAAGPQVFRLEGDTRTITFDGSTVLLRDLKGLRYLERLLADPGREIHALDLVAVERGSLPIRATSGPEGERANDHAGAVFDEQARAAYRRRLAEIEDDIDEATAMGDLERAARAEADREYLVMELARGVGLGGRHRFAAATSERARTSVTRALRYALDRIAAHHPSLGEHLERTLRTGVYCCYLPDPRAEASWVV